jgi:hypothetical protein
MRARLYLSFGLGLALFGLSSIPLLAATQHFYDTFTEASNTAIESHDPDVGGGVGAWAVVQDPSALTQRVTATTDILILTTVDTDSTNVILIATPDSGPSTADYSVAFSSGQGDNTRPLCAILRYQDTSNYYAGCFLNNTQNPDAFIYENVGGVTSTLASSDCATNASLTWTFSGSGTTLRLRNTGSCNFTATDPSISATGKGGVGCGNISGTGTHGCDLSSAVDNFEIASDAPVGGPARLLLLGVGGE